MFHNHSITSSARPSSESGTVRPSALAVLRLMTSSTLVDLLDRQVGRLLALENPAGVDADLTVSVRNAGSIAHQAAGRDELAKLSRSWAPRGGPPVRRAVRSGY